MEMLLALLVSLLWVSFATGAYELQLRANSYQNPSGRCDECRGPNGTVPRCCDEGFDRPLNQTCLPTCDTTVDICFRPRGSTGLNCDLNSLFFGTEIGTDSNSFAFRTTFFGFLNPTTAVSANAWAGIQVLFIFLDCSGSNCGVTQVIDSFPVDIQVIVGTISRAMEYIGSAGIARFNFTFEVRCAENFYGRDCLTNCLDFRSCSRCGLPGFTWEFCQYTVSSCREMFCSGNGACVDGGSACVCDAGYTGDDCQDKIFGCGEMFCNGNGDCVDDSGLACVCDVGYTGDDCRRNIDDCANVNCTAGECVDGINSFVCNCEPGFTGNFCQLNIDDCNPTSCNSNGECIDGISNFTCCCNAGFTGQFCALNIDDCEGVNCNNGKCVDEVNGFRCECEPNYSGGMCDEASSCVGVTCSGNGICISASESFDCTCNTGFSGDLCQEETTSVAASSINVGGITGGVLGALIAAIVLAIVAVLVAFIKHRRNRNLSTLNVTASVTPSPSDIFPGDNPAYGARERVNGAYQVTVPLDGSADGQTGISTSVHERDFNNPLYSQNDILIEETYTTVEFRSSNEDRYAVPSSIPAVTSSIPAAPSSIPAIPSSIHAAPSSTLAVPGSIPPVSSSISTVSRSIPSVSSSVIVTSRSVPAVSRPLPAVSSSFLALSTSVPAVSHSISSITTPIPSSSAVDTRNEEALYAIPGSPPDHDNIYEAIPGAEDTEEADAISGDGGYYSIVRT